MIYFLGFLLIIFLIFQMFVFNKDIFQPSIIVNTMFSIGVIFLIYSINIWKVSLSIDTVVVILTGVIVFFIASVISKKMLCKKQKVVYELKIISIKYWKIVLIVIIGIITLIMHYKWLVEIVNKHGGANDYSTMISLYRSLITNSIENTNSMPFALRQLLRIITAVAYINLYIFINNIIIDRKKIKKYIIYLIPVVLYLLDSMLFAARGYMINIFLAGLVFWYVLFSRNRGKFSLNAYILKKSVLILIVMIVLFVGLRQAVGRSMSYKAKSDPIYYISVYIGAPIQLLDDFIKNPIQTNDRLWGQETFNAFYNYVYTKSDSNSKILSGDLEFRYSNGYNIGNVYTAFRTYLSDFGYFGMIICTAIVSIFYSIFYAKIKYSSKMKVFDFSLLIYGYLINGLFFFSIAERPFSSFFTPGIITTFITYYIVLLFLIGRKKENEKNMLY